MTTHRFTRTTAAQKLAAYQETPAGMAEVEADKQQAAQEAAEQAVAKLLEIPTVTFERLLGDEPQKLGRLPHHIKKMAKSLAGLGATMPDGGDPMTMILWIVARLQAANEQPKAE